MYFSRQTVEKVLSSGKAPDGHNAFLRAPIYDPQKVHLCVAYHAFSFLQVICVGLNYRDHAIESGMPIPEEPVVFTKFPSCIVGPNDNIVKPSRTTELDYEVWDTAVHHRPLRPLSRSSLRRLRW